MWLYGGSNDLHPKQDLWSYSFGKYKAWVVSGRMITVTNYTQHGSLLD